MNVAYRPRVKTNTDHFSEENLTKLKDIMYVEKYETASKIYWEGDPEKQLYFLLDGKVKLTKLNEFGKDLTLYIHFPGDMFGQFDPSNEQVTTFTADVVETCQVGVLQQRELEMLLKKHGDLSAEFARWQSHTQQYTQLKLRDLLFYGKNGALASILIRTSNTYGIKDGDRIKITEKFTNYELANLIGATRETVNRLLSTFKKKNLINYDNGRIEILDLNGLKAINRCDDCSPDICRL